MGQHVLLGIGAGAASALLSASVASGSVLSLLLYYMAPLPILIASMGWSHQAGLVAAAVAAASLGALFGISYLLLFLIDVALPACVLGYLSLLARPAGSNGSTQLEWYPVGRLLLWAALFGTLVAVLAIPEFSASKSQLQTAVKELFERMQGPTNPNGWSSADVERAVAITVEFVLPMAATNFTLRNAVNLWLAGRIVNMSGRLKRPWPDLSSFTLPPLALTLLGIAAIGSIIPNIAGTAAGILAAGLITAYALLGFAILHAITRGIAFRAYLLFAVYFTVIALAVPLLGLPIFAIALLGLADTAFNIRGRRSQKHGPPTLPT